MSVMAVCRERGSKMQDSQTQRQKVELKQLYFCAQTELGIQKKLANRTNGGGMKVRCRH